MIFANTKERILYFIDFKRIKLSSFFKATGIKRGFLDRDKLESSVSDIFIAKIIESYPELNLEWLICGKGEMLKQESVGQDFVDNKSLSREGDLKQQIINDKEEIIALQRKMIETLELLNKKNEQIINDYKKNINNNL